MIQVNHLTKIYPGSTQKAVDDVSFVLDSGKIDLDDVAIRNLDYIMVGMHKDAKGFTDEGIVKNTKKYIFCLKKNPVKIITHPIYVDKVSFDYKKVIRFALENDIIPEFNLSLLPRKIEFSRFKWLVDEIKRQGKRMIINSDAHFLHGIGNDSLFNKDFKKKLDITPNLVWNNYPFELLEFLGIRKFL